MAACSAQVMIDLWHVLMPGDACRPGLSELWLTYCQVLEAETWAKVMTAKNKMGFSHFLEGLCFQAGMTSLALALKVNGYWARA